MPDTAMPAGVPSTEAPDAAGVFRIWPGDGRAPGSEAWSWAESTMPIPWAKTGRRLSRNVVVPTVTAFLPPAGRANGTAMIIAPGGASHFLMIDHEGYDMARWLTGLGVTAFVLKYRLARTPDADAELLDFRNTLQARLAHSGPMGDAPPSNPIIEEIRLLAEEDGRQAIRFVRQHAAGWSLDPGRIGIAGFSAGGAPAIGAMQVYDAQSRPDFGIGVYPAYRGGLPVPADAPPLFLVIADDDRAVAPLSSARLYEAWHRAGRSAELHVFANGAHGFAYGLNGLLSDAWVGLLANWLAVKGLLPR